MGEVMWLEVLGRHREVASRHRLDGAFSIGRAYDNDLILDDPTIAAHHLVLGQDETGAWFAEDRGSVNGLYLENSTKRETRVALAGEEVLHIGRTLLRARKASFAVAPERRIEAPTRHWPLIGWTALASVVLILLSTWLGQTAKSEVSNFVGPVAAGTMMILVWVGFWSLVSRLFAGQARFERHLLVALVGLLASLALEDVWKFAAFSLAIPLSTIMSSAMGWILIAIVAYAHLRVIGPGWLRLKAASVAAIALALIGYQWMTAREQQRNTGFTADAPALLPPAMRVVSGKNEVTFFEAAGQLRSRVDKLRTEDLKDNPE